MDRPEFNRWFADFSARFPDRVRWLGQNRTAAEAAAIKTTWEETLSASKVDDALEANRCLQSGEVTWPASIDLVPATIRGFCRDLDYARDRPGALPTMCRCEFCKDSGFRRVWEAAALRAILARRPLPSIRSGVVRCECRPYPPDAKAHNPVRMFDPSADCPVIANDTHSESAIEEVRAWLEIHREHHRRKENKKLFNERE